MPVFDKNAAYLWAIIWLGVMIPVLMAAGALLRTHLARKKLDRLLSEE